MEVDALIELHDSELLGATRILAHLQSKYQGESKRKLPDLVKEAEFLFERIGLLITCDPFQRDPRTKEPVFTIKIADRVTPFDPDRQDWEVKRGVADEFWTEQRKKPTPTSVPEAKPLDPELGEE